KRALLFFGNFFLEEEALRALQAEGVEPMVFSYNTYRGAPDFEDALQRAVQTNRPDFVLSINMKGFDGFGAAEEITARLGVPLVVWFVDDPRPILMHRTAYVKSHLIAACWERSYLPYLRDAGCAAVAHVPLATDRTLFFPGGENTPRVNVGFVGTAMVDAFAGRIRDKFLWSQSLTPLVELVSEQLLANPPVALRMEEAIRVCAKALTLTLPFFDVRNITWLATYCIHTASMKKRNRVIGNLISYGIETFGDPEGWKELLGPALPTHPNIDYRRGLRDAYRDIRCNVNVTSCQMPTAVNQRVFDIPSCGSFVISDNQPDMRELFALGTEAIAYETIDDLKEKISFYTSHETARQAVIRAAQNRIAGEHTYDKRLQAIVALVRG
ncbi:MAG TPA: glycosyltransferase, partial [Chitinivibrionales bacterium]